jgi:hypothetical protein
MWFWPVVAVVLGSGLRIFWLMDRRARRMGHVVRPGYGMYRSLRENRRDVRVLDGTSGWLNVTQGLGWTALSRRNADSKREQRRDETRDNWRRTVPGWSPFSGGISLAMAASDYWAAKRG